MIDKFVDTRVSLPISQDLENRPGKYPGNYFSKYFYDKNIIEKRIRGRGSGVRVNLEDCLINMNRNEFQAPRFSMSGGNTRRAVVTFRPDP